MVKRLSVLLCPALLDFWNLAGTPPFCPTRVARVTSQVVMANLDNLRLYILESPLSASLDRNGFDPYSIQQGEDRALRDLPKYGSPGLCREADRPTAQLREFLAPTISWIRPKTTRHSNTGDDTCRVDCSPLTCAFEATRFVFETTSKWWRMSELNLHNMCIDFDPLQLALNHLGNLPALRKVVFLLHAKERLTQEDMLLISKRLACSRIVSRYKRDAISIEWFPHPDAERHVNLDDDGRVTIFDPNDTVMEDLT
ncbi:hypothetical protein IAU59_003251 [Kwoniella sp. CBS 9459]